MMMEQYPDIQLVQRLQEGDLTAYDALFAKYYKMLCANAYWVLRNEEEAKDVVQTFFLDIWDKKLYLQFNNDIKGYLHTAVKNRCLNHLRNEKRKEERHSDFLQLEEDAAGAAAIPDYSGQLRNSLNNMAGQKRVAIHMVYMEGKRYQEAADEMGISINSFKTHLKNGLKLLRSAIHHKKDH